MFLKTSLKERFEEFLFFILGLGFFFVSHPVLPLPPPPRLFAIYKNTSVDGACLASKFHIIFQRSQIPPPNALPGPLPSAPPERERVPHLRARQTLFSPTPAMAQGCWGHGLSHPPQQGMARPHRPGPSHRFCRERGWPGGSPRPRSHRGAGRVLP